MPLKSLEHHNHKRRQEFSEQAANRPPESRKNGFQCPNTMCGKELTDVVTKEILAEIKKKKEAGALVKQPVKCSCGYRGFRYL